MHIYIIYLYIIYRALSFIVTWVNHFNEDKVPVSEVTSLTYQEVRLVILLLCLKCVYTHVHVCACL